MARKKKFRPLHVLWQQGITKETLDGVFSGVAFVLSLAGVFQEFKIELLDQRREQYWLIKGGFLNQYRSLDWHMWWARYNRKKPWHLNSVVLLDSLRDNPTYQINPRYELVAVNEPLHWDDASLRTVGGIGRQGHGAIISIGQYLPMPTADYKERKQRRFDYLIATQMLTMHELGHVFGLFPGTGVINPTDDDLKAAHCQNDCVMWWQTDQTLNRIIVGRPFCPDCMAKLKQFFIAL